MQFLWIQWSDSLVNLLLDRTVYVLVPFFELLLDLVLRDRCDKIHANVFMRTLLAWLEDEYRPVWLMWHHTCFVKSNSFKVHFTSRRISFDRSTSFNSLSNRLSLRSLSFSSCSRTNLCRWSPSSPFDLSFLCPLISVFIWNDFVLFLRGILCMLNDACAASDVDRPATFGIDRPVFLFEWVLSMSSIRLSNNSGFSTKTLSLSLIDMRMKRRIIKTLWLAFLCRYIYILYILYFILFDLYYSMQKVRFVRCVSAHF